MYRLVDKLYQIAVINPANGHVVWKDLASPGAITPGVVVTPAVIGSDVIYLRPARSVSNAYYATYVVVADGATGKVKARSTFAYLVTKTPQACGKKVCWQAQQRYRCHRQTCLDQWADNSVRDITMKPDGGTPVVQRRADVPSSRPVGPAGLIDLRSDGVEYLARTNAHGVMWKRPESEVFGPGFTTDSGWVFHHLSRQHLFVGSIGYDEGGRHATLQFGRHSKVVAFDDRTGHRRWARSGLSPFCLSGMSTFQAVACHFGATTEASWDNGAFVFRHASVSLTGYDPATGKTTWTVPLASPSGMVYSDWVDSMRRVGEHGLLVRGRSGPVVVDLTSGATSALGARDVLCPSRDEVRLRFSVWTRPDGTTLFTRTTDTALTPCTPAGKAVRPSSPMPSWVGAHVGNVTVVLTKHGLVGYR